MDVHLSPDFLLLFFVQIAGIGALYGTFSTRLKAVEQAQASTPDLSSTITKLETIVDRVVKDIADLGDALQGLARSFAPQPPQIDQQTARSVLASLVQAAKGA